MRREPTAPDSGDLLERGSDLATKLAGFGHRDGADVVALLVSRLRSIRDACAF